MAQTRVTADQRLLLTASEAADLLGLTGDAFTRDVAPDLRCVPIRSSWRYPRKELERWLDEHARAKSVADERALSSAADLPRADMGPRAFSTDERLLLTAVEACDLLGVSRDVFREDIAPRLRGVEVRSATRYSRRELEKWVARAEGM